MNDERGSGTADGAHEASGAPEVDGAPGVSGAARLGGAAGRDGAQLVTPRLIAAAVIRPLVAATVLLVGYFLLPINRESGWNEIGLACGAALLILFCAWEIRQFRRSVHPLSAALEMLTAVTGLYVVAFASTYFMFSDYSPGSFSERLTRVDALYFCLTVLTTTGFGDIAAQDQPARIAVSIQMVSTLILLGLGIRFLSQLVTVRVREVRTRP